MGTPQLGITSVQIQDTASFVGEHFASLVMFFQGKGHSPRSSAGKAEELLTALNKMADDALHLDTARRGAA